MAAGDKTGTLLQFGAISTVLWWMAISIHSFVNVVLRLTIPYEEIIFGVGAPGLSSTLRFFSVPPKLRVCRSILGMCNRYHGRGVGESLVPPVTRPSVVRETMPFRCGAVDKSGTGTLFRRLTMCGRRCRTAAAVRLHLPAIAGMVGNMLC
jgi:hypothetical protein